MENVTKYIIKYALLIVFGLVIFFLAMRMLGLEHNFELRLFNAFIMYGGIYFLLQEIRKNQGSIQYLTGLGSGLIASAIVGVIFSIFMSLFAYYDQSFMASIKANEPQGIYMNELAVGLLIFIEAIASGILFTYATMQFIKEKKTQSSSNK